MDWFLYDRTFGNKRVKGMNYPAIINDLLNSKAWNKLIVLKSYTYAGLKNPQYTQKLYRNILHM